MESRSRSWVLIAPRWQMYLEERIRFLVLRDFFKKQLCKRLPPHTGLLHVFGSLALLTFLNQFVTGILLLLYYRPTLKEAHESIQYISGDVAFGWLASQPNVASVIAGLLFYVLAAHALARYQGPGKGAVETLLSLPLVLPPTVLGFYILVAIGPRSPIGRAYQALTAETLPFSFEGLLIASVLYSLPFAVQPFASAFAAVDRNLIETSWCLGASTWRTFFRIIVPLARPGIITGVVLSFAHTMGEFGVVLMVGGNIEGVTRTVSIDIYDEVQALNYSAAANTALFLLIVSYAVLVFIYAMNRKVWAVWPQK